MRHLGRAAFSMGLVLVSTVAGCRGRSVDPGRTVARDSAGVHIVETTKPRQPINWSLDTAREVSIGVADGEAGYLLSRVVGATRLPDGDIVVADGGSATVRFYDAKGRYLRESGGAGQGPGEFGYMRTLGRCRTDGFVVFDLNWQMNMYRDDGTFVDRRVFKDSEETPYRLACDEEGHFVTLGWGAEVREGTLGLYEAHSHLRMIGPDGSTLTDFGERLVSVRIGDEHGSGPHPVGLATVFALGDGVLYVGSGATFQVEVRGLDGSHRELLRGPESSLAVTDSLKEVYARGVLSHASPERLPGVRSQLARMPWPETYPAYTDLRVDRMGVVWAKQLTLDADEPERWSLLDERRGYLGDLVLPLRERLLEAGPDYLLTLSRDDVGVERVVERRLLRGPDR